MIDAAARAQAVTGERSRVLTDARPRDQLGGRSARRAGVRGGVGARPARSTTRTLIGMASAPRIEEFPADTTRARRRARAALIDSAGDRVRRISDLAGRRAHDGVQPRRRPSSTWPRRTATSTRCARCRGGTSCRRASSSPTSSDAMLDHIEAMPDRADELLPHAYGTQINRGTVDAGAALLLATVTVRYSQGRLAELVPTARAGLRDSAAGAGTSARHRAGRGRRSRRRAAGRRRGAAGVARLPVPRDRDRCAG